MSDFLLMVGGAIFAMFVSGIVNYKKSKWTGLSEQERNDIEDTCEMMIGKPAFDAIEAKLKEKNT